MAEHMEHRRLGQSGLKVSVLSFGSWINFGPAQAGLAAECMQAAYDGGMTFFDNAEVYGGGESERLMGQAIAQLGWARHTYTVSTKLFWGIEAGPNTKNTLNRKYLMHAIDGSLERFGLDFVDLLYCHRPDPETPIEETVWAMSDIIDRGAALYWGTSEWSSAEIRSACEIADRHHLRKPIVEQPQYNLFEREKVEHDYLGLYENEGIGLTTWSPLASGLLTGKYLKGVPEDSRGAIPGYEWLRDRLIDPANNDKVRGLTAISDELGCTLAQMSIAWCAANPNVSSVITGASRVSQVQENLKAAAVIPLLTPEVLARIDQAMATR